MSGERIQMVRITLSDGRSGWFSGPELVHADDAGKVKVSSTEFHEAQDMPHGYRWRQVGDVSLPECFGEEAGKR